MRKQRLTLFFVLLLSMTLWGCGSDRGGSTAVNNPDIADAATTGNCTICHTIDTHTFLNGIAGVNPDANGLGSAITHDCENCHGGGEFHHGLGPIPFPSPEGDRCATCHEQATKIIASTHNHSDDENVSMIATSTRYSGAECARCHTAEGFMALKHITGDDGTGTNDAEVEIDRIVEYGSALLPGQVEGLNNVDADGNIILHWAVCGTCHNPLTKEMNTADPSWTPNGSSSDQLALCTACHFYKFNDGEVAVAGNTYSVSTTSGLDGIFFTADDDLSAGTTTGVVGHHDTSWYRIIATTHYDNPDSPLVIEGYNIRENSASPCFDCHGHELRTNTRRHGENDPTDPQKVETIHTEWAQSPHAGYLLNVKEEAGSTPDQKMAVGVTEETAPAWIHYNWDSTLQGDGVTSDRGDCQMCHTATGAANFMDDQVGYDPLDNDFSHLEGWNAIGGSPAQEVIYCWTCHTDVESGETRDPGAVTLAYTNILGVNPTLPDFGNSNVCVNCHSGRGGMDRLLNTAITNPPNPAGAAVTGGTRTHYFASGGTINQELTNIGYMYYDTIAGAFLNYDDPSYFGHNSLGCADCHMTAATASEKASHTFKVVNKDDTGAITSIASEKCVECHDGEHALFVAESLVGTTQNIWNGTAAVPTTVTQAMADAATAELEHEAEGYHNALEAFAAVMTGAGTAPTTSYPYFAGAATDQGHGGAMHNYSYLHHEPGGFAHNRFYVKRLIFDSIDWLTSAAGVVQVDPVATPRALDGQITLDPINDADAIAWLGGDPVTGVTTRP